MALPAADEVAQTARSSRGHWIHEPRSVISSSRGRRRWERRARRVHPPSARRSERWVRGAPQARSRPRSGMTEVLYRRERARAIQRCASSADSARMRTVRRECPSTGKRQPPQQRRMGLHDRDRSRPGRARSAWDLRAWGCVLAPDARVYEHALAREATRLAEGGPLVVDTGVHGAVSRTSSSSASLAPVTDLVGRVAPRSREASAPPPEVASASAKATSTWWTPSPAPILLIAWRCA